MDDEKIVIALGSMEEVPEEILEKIQKWAFMWLHEHGFEGEMGKGIIQERECHFILVDKPSQWKESQVIKLLQSFGKSLQKYLANS